jgi:hypothetical protein
METYMIVRRRAWRTRAAATAATRRADTEAERLSEVVAHVRSYVLDETDGTMGSICVYEAVGPEAIRRHSTAARLPIDEILKVAAPAVGP